MLRATRARLERLEHGSPPEPPRVIVLTLLPSSTEADRQRHFDRVERATGRAISARDVVLITRHDATGRNAVMVDGVPI